MNYSKHNYQVKFFKMMSNSNRLKVLKLLAANKEPINVTEIAEAVNIEITTLSNHLFKMREIGLVKAKQSGLNMFYSVKDPAVSKILGCF